MDKKAGNVGDALMARIPARTSKRIVHEEAPANRCDDAVNPKEIPLPHLPPSV